MHESCLGLAIFSSFNCTIPSSNYIIIIIFEHIVKIKSMH